MFLAATLLLLLLVPTLLLLLRCRTRMAALIAWIVGSITGGRDDNKEADKKTPLVDKEKTKPRSTRGRQKVRESRLEEPSFATTLTTPIEEIIEETINEEQSESKSNKPRKRNKQAVKNKARNAEDNVGFSFPTSAKHENPIRPEKKTTVTAKLVEPTESEETDTLGYSFLPVKDKRSGKKINQKPKIDDLPKSELIEQVQSKKRSVKEPPFVKKDVPPLEVNTDEFVLIDKIESGEDSEIRPRENIIEIVNKSSGKIVYLEVKESKKVDSKISYASIASQRFEEKPTTDQQQPRQSGDFATEQESEAVKTSKDQFNCSSSFEYIDTENRITTVADIHSQEPVITYTTDITSIENQALEEKTSPIIVDECVDEIQLLAESRPLIEFDIYENSNLNDAVAQEENCIEEDPETNSIQHEESNPGEEVVTEETISNKDIDLNGETLPSLESNWVEIPIEVIEEKEVSPENLINRIDIEEVVTENYTSAFSEEIESDPALNSIINTEEVVGIESAAPIKMSSGTQVRVLTLNDKEHQESTLYRIEKDWILQFRLGPSLLGRKVSLYCNYPKTGEFDRHTYHLLKWSQDEGCDHADDTALLTEIVAKVSGSFHYYFIYENADEAAHQGSGFFLVDPILKYGNNEDLPLDCIQCQTVLAKSLGPFNTWQNKLRVAKESGYNMIHFTPIQELGASNSSYSLSGQLKVNPVFTKENGDKTTFQDIENLIAKMRKDWKVTSICDIVLNHTANESDWLIEHPEVTYNCANCPYMRPAYLLDATLHQFSLDIVKGVYEDRGIPVEVNTEEHLNSIRYHLQSEVLPKVNIPEMFMCDVNKYVDEFMNLARNKVQPSQTHGEVRELKLIQDPLYRRLGTTVDMDLALKLYNVYRNDCFDEETRVKRCVEDFKKKLDFLNNLITIEINEHLSAAVENCIAGIRYFRVQPDGPRIKEVSKKNPLVYRYFTDHGRPVSMKEHEDIMYSDNGRFLMAHNGWVMNTDPLRNFAAPDSNVYIRRELIAWGDSVKLRYGDKPEDCPFLWNHMRAYVEQTARIFDGVRLDNCHSTPIPVAEYLLDCARKVRPDLYVVAELFTNSDMTDNIFVNRLGITSLIREAMSAWDSHEQGRLVYRYGGCPVGSFYQPRIRPLVPSIAHALFLDLTHDNPSPVEKRSVFDLLPSTALVNMACCASGSNRGYDELVPHHIHVVDESRQYTEWSDDDNNLAKGNLRYVTGKCGIIAAKKALNDLHFLLGAKGFNQVYVDQMDPDIVAVTRHCPETHQSYVLVAFTAFGHPPNDAQHHQRGIRPLRVEGVLDEIVLEATLSHISIKASGFKYEKFNEFIKDSKWINGLSEYQVQVKQHIQPEDSDFFEKVESGTVNMVQLNFKNFKPGSVAIIKLSLPEGMHQAIKNVRNLISQFSMKKETELSQIVNKLTLPDLNRILYRCDQEERDEGHGFDTYDIPNFGRLVYAGLQGFMSLLSTIRPNNDLGHPMCGNLRDGNWMIDYIWKRLKLDDGTKELGQWLEENTKSFESIPRYLIPCYFDVIITGLYVLLVEKSYNLMSDFIKHGSAFVRGLSMGSVQFAGYIKSADLPTLSPNLAAPKPPQRKTENGQLVQACVTLSAGLPHFAVGYMRNWGRDTFIAMRGLFLLTGRYADARYHILGYGACLRHGLIPNLLDGGRNSRFNCRDAVWWWLYCIKCYAEDAPNGLAILSDVVSRIFPKDDSPAQSPGVCDQTLQDVIQEALTVHFQGLVFRERNAGKQIDEHMTDRGFNNQIGIHPETGFVFGGNDANCGTWMDKMGSSDKAGNRGKPATPRDGSAVELIGLSKSVVSWLDKLNRQGVYPYNGVERTHKNGNVTKWTFKEWADKIQLNFEKFFWVNTVPVDGEIRPDLINKRGIYKDCYGASQEWTDFQLRCNFPITMVVAPELFNPQHAWIALEMAEKYLLGPLGMKTLDPEDWAYNGNYDNSNDSDNPSVANGFNYHQGPEWVWPVGFYLRAKLHFAKANGQLDKALQETKVVLSKHFVELQTSTWRGLPELTNKDGAYCRDSSRTQAWSMSCILEVLHDLQKIEMEEPRIN